jgi:hypothetical protein
VITNDPRHPETQLSISGPVKVFATITPENVRLFGPIDSALKETVRIVPEESYPFKILDAKAQVGKDIQYHISQDHQALSTTYLLTVENLKQTTGRFYDTITLTTDSRIKPKISIRVYGKIRGPESPKTN